MADKDFNKTNPFVEELAKAVHEFDTAANGGDQLKIALTDTDPTDSIANYSEIASPLAADDFDGTDPFDVTTTESGQTNGTYKLVCDDVTLTCTSNNTGPFQYVVLYNDSATNKEVIGYYDYEQSITLHDNDTFKVDFDQTDGVFTLV